MIRVIVMSRGYLLATLSLVVVLASCSLDPYRTAAQILPFDFSSVATKEKVIDTELFTYNNSSELYRAKKATEPFTGIYLKYNWLGRLESALFQSSVEKSNVSDWVPRDLDLLKSPILRLVSERNTTSEISQVRYRVNELQGDGFRVELSQADEVSLAEYFRRAEPGVPGIAIKVTF